VIAAMAGVAMIAPSPAFADMPQINQSVIIKCGNIGGTGFFLPSGSIITAAHVVKKCKSVELLNNGGEKGTGKVLYVAQADDIAIISGSTLATPKNLQPLDLHPVVDSEPVTIVGTPIDGLVLSQGKVFNSLPTYQPRTFSLVVPADHGNSGGPVFSGSGIIGLVIEKTTDGKIIALNASVISSAVKNAENHSPTPRASSNGGLVVIQDNSAPKLQISLLFNALFLAVIIALLLARRKRFSRKKIVINIPTQSSSQPNNEMEK
jgi:Trypsin-like peptidase domain